MHFHFCCFLYRHTTDDKYYVEARDPGAREVLVIDRLSQEIYLESKCLSYRIVLIAAHSPVSTHLSCFEVVNHNIINHLPRSVHSGLEINFFTHSQNFASASKIYSLNWNHCSLRLRSKSGPNILIIKWFLIVTVTMTALVTTAYNPPW